LAIGDMGMTYSEMMQSTLSEIMIKQHARARENELQLHNTRLIMWEIRTKYVKKHQSVKISDIFRLSFDAKANEKPLLSKDEFMKYALNRN